MGQCAEAGLEDSRAAPAGGLGLCGWLRELWVPVRWLPVQGGLRQCLSLAAEPCGCGWIGPDASLRLGAPQSCAATSMAHPSTLTQPRASLIPLLRLTLFHLQRETYTGLHYPSKLPKGHKFEREKVKR